MNKHVWATAVHTIQGTCLTRLLFLFLPFSFSVAFSCSPSSFLWRSCSDFLFGLAFFVTFQYLKNIWRVRMRHCLHSFETEVMVWSFFLSHFYWQKLKTGSTSLRQRWSTQTTRTSLSVQRATWRWWWRSGCSWLPSPCRDTRRHTGKSLHTQFLPTRICEIPLVFM